MNVFVTGGSRGIGRAIALRFARDGAKRVAIGYLRNDRAAEATAEELRALGAEPTLVRGNVTSERVLGEVAALGPLDVLVHNAATGVIRPALETEDKHWDWTMNTNARALLQLARVAAPQMPDGSSIVAISSLGAQRVLENYTLVGTSKAALESLVRYLAVELAPRVRVNARLGRRRRDGRARALPEPRGDARRRAREPGRPDGRRRTTSRRAVAFLCSPDADDDPRPDADRRRRLLAARLSASQFRDGGCHRGAGSHVCGFVTLTSRWQPMEVNVTSRTGPFGEAARPRSQVVAKRGDCRRLRWFAGRIEVRRAGHTPPTWESPSAS